MRMLWRASFAAETRTHYKRNKSVDIPLALQPFHNPRQFGAYPRSLNCVIVRNGIRQKAFKFLDVVVKAGHHLSAQNRQNLS